MKTAKQAYWMHKFNATKRGIAFLFTFEDWLSWWVNQLGPDWQKKRGMGRGKYVMARNGDIGPYTPKNVRCILHEENCREQAANGRSGRKRGSPNKHGSHWAIIPKKINAAQAREIYFAQGTQKSIADSYGVSPRLVRLIKAKQTWKHVVKNL